MDKKLILSKIEESGVVPVIRGKIQSRQWKSLRLLKKGGIKVIEITMTVSGAIDVIKELSEKYQEDSDIIFGVGSVLDCETTKTAILAGTEFIVGPALDKEMIEVANW